MVYEFDVMVSQVAPNPIVETRLWGGINGQPHR